MEMIERGISTYLETVYFVPTFPQFADWEAKSEQEKLLGTQFFCWPENLKKRRQYRILVVHSQQMTWTKHLNAGSDEDGRNPAITKQAACMRGCWKRGNNKRLVPQGLIYRLLYWSESILWLASVIKLQSLFLTLNFFKHLIPWILQTALEAPLWISPPAWFLLLRWHSAQNVRERNT